MPNWITNDVEMVGDVNTIKKIFKKHFRKGCIDFDTIIPQPKTKKECPKQYICDPVEAHIEPTKGREWFNWYNWNYDNWGVKWNACEGYAEKDVGYFRFDTPWGCPKEVLKRLASLYPTIKFIVNVDGEIDEPYSFELN